jgi:CheY-like chemotaxis protein
LPRKILLADDSVTAQNMGRKILVDAGYEVVTVSNGSAALKKIAEQHPDLIVLDVYMPGYSGLEVCQRLKDGSETARIPIILTVGKLEPFKPQDALRAHADAFLIKPFDAQELLRALVKLEEKIVPPKEPYKPGRFAKAIASIQAAVDADFGEAEQGWKSRLTIPDSKRKKAEPEPEPQEDFTTNAKTFRDWDAQWEAPKPAPPKPPAKPKVARSARAVDAEPERNLASLTVPYDATAEELSAIAAAAARISAAAKLPVEESPDGYPPPLTQTLSTAFHSLAKSLQPSASTETAPIKESPESPSPAASNAAEESLNAKTPGAPEPLAPSPRMQEVPGHAAPSPAIFRRAIQQEQSLPEPEKEPAAAAPAEAGKARPPQELTGSPHFQDPDDEPGFARQGWQEEPRPIHPVAASRAEIQAEPRVPVQTDPVQADTPKASPEAATVPPGREAAKETEEKSGSKTELSENHAAADAEVLAALATLEGPLEDKTAGAAPSQSAAKTSAPSACGPRWTAEEVAVTSEESAIRLGDEMEKAFAAFAAADGFRGGYANSGGVSSQTGASSVAVLESEPPASLAAAGETKAETEVEVEAISVENLATPVCESGPPQATECKSTQDINPETAPEVDSGAGVESPMAKGDEADAEASDEALHRASATAWAHWRQIRDSMFANQQDGDASSDSNSDTSSAQPVTMQDAGLAQPPAHAKAAAAASSAPSSESSPQAQQNAPAAKAPSDAGTAGDPIASIVESVLAELKPKLMEEIAKKLGKS